MTTPIQKAEGDRTVIESGANFITQRISLHPTNSLSLHACNDLIKKIDNYETSLEEVHRRLCNLTTDVAPHTITYHKIAGELLSAKEKLYDIRSSNPAPTAAGSSSSTSFNNDLKLPRLEIPQFTGDIQDWISYRDIFIAVVHSKSSIGKVQKFTYLKTTVSGEAAKLIQSLPLSEDNYDVAWQALTDRYNNDRELLFDVLKKMFNQPMISSSNSASVRNLIDQTKANIRSFNLLKGNTENLFLYIMTTKLDLPTRELWYQHTDHKKIPEISELYSFLEQRALALSAGTAPAKPQRPKPITHHIQSSNNCLMKCNSPHPLYKCQAFRDLSVQDRQQRVYQNHLCNNCLRYGHTTASCDSQSTCRTCNRRHHTLLHNQEKVQRSTQQQPSSSSSVQSNHQCSQAANPALLATAVVQVQGQFGTTLCRILLDSGATNSFITEGLVKRLGLPVVNSTTHITGMASTPVGQSNGIVEIQLSPHFTTKIKLEATAYIIPRISSKQPQTRFNIDDLKHLQNLELADPSFHIPAPVDILLGSDLFWDIIGGGKRRGKPNQPIAVNSSLGWLISGKNETTTTIQSHMTNIQLNAQLEKFWNYEDNNKVATPELTLEEQACEDIFTTTTSRDINGRFNVAIPWKSPRPAFGDSRVTAYKRLLQMEKRLATKTKKYSLEQNQSFKNEYITFMREYEQLSHMEPIPPSEIMNPRNEVFYIPHHFVLKEDSSTTKFRTVFDGSALSSNGTSLNKAMMVGPTVQSTLFQILLRFRLHPIVFTADIAKMYRQILIKEEDRDLHRILWRESPTDPVKEYRLKTVTYGTAAAPYLATRCLLQLATENIHKYPLAAEVAKHDAYVDDIQSGSNDLPTATATVAQLLTMCSTACFPLRKWTSNSQQLLDTIDPELRETQSVIPIGDENSQTVKTLGIYWKPCEDIYTFKITLPEEPASQYTKRVILSEMSKLFDPLGWLAPVTFKAKLLMQTIWKTKLDWDEPQPLPIQEEWIKYKSTLKKLESHNIPRFILTPKSTYHLIGFSDASEKGYAAVVYIASTSKQPPPNMRLLTSKTRVAPIDPISLPRLELNAAVLLADLMTTVHQALNFKFDSIQGFTDSTITLGWINSDPNRWKTYVRNRVAQIQRANPTIQWSHIPGDVNPADCASRGLFTEELLSHSLWWNGNPSILTNLSSSSQSQLFDFSPVKHEEQQPKVQCNIGESSQQQQSQFLVYFSSFHQLKKIAAVFTRAISNRKLKKLDQPVTTGPITSDELNQAQRAILKWVQSLHFKEEVHHLSKNKQLPTTSKLLSLNPFVDQGGLLRVGGRLRNAPIADDAKYPVLLPRHHVTTLIIRSIHLQNLHSGNTLTHSILNQQFWVIRARDAIRMTLRQCVTCTRQRAKTVQQIMGNLPEARVTPARAFLQCGVDCAGPFLLRNPGRSKVTSKAYLVVFVCFTTRALHLEVSSSLSTDAFLATFRRFISRRGKPNDMYSDCGTNFVGANKELTELHQLLQSTQIIPNAISSEGIRWHFNPPGAPHFGGIWEAGVKSVKYHLHRVMGQHCLTYEEFITLTTQIEGILNSRPITALSSDPCDPQPLTPAHFLIGAPLVGLPEPALDHLNINRLDRWQLIQAKQQSFWKRWSSEFISRLQQRPKWMKTSRPIREDDIVLIKDDNLPPAKWKLGRVIARHPGADNITRVVTLKTMNGEIKRPITKICLLPICDEDI